MLSRREIVCGLAMAGAAGVAFARHPDIKLDYLGDHKLDQVVPRQVGRWNFVSSSGLVVPPKDQLALTLYSQLLTRIYYDGETPIMLLIAYSASQNGFLQVHRPEFCYTAAGYQLSEFAPHDVRLGESNSIRVNTLTATRDGSNEKLLYWTRIGNHIPLSWPQQKLVFAEDNLKRLIPDAALIRVSTVGADERRSMQVLDTFVQSMISAIRPDLRRIFVV
jgi:EpsI family protein